MRESRIVIISHSFYKFTKTTRW